jgi:hypothetical protein
MCLAAAVDWDDNERISSDEFLPASNKGFQLLLKMGWSTGTGPTRAAIAAAAATAAAAAAAAVRLMCPRQGWDAPAAGGWSRSLSRHKD